MYIGYTLRLNFPCSCVQEVEAEWAAKLQAAKDEADGIRASLRADLTAQMEAITRRLEEMVATEARRERKRAALVAEVDALKVAADEEFRRRCQLERALRDSASLFKRELHEKNEELLCVQVIPARSPTVPEHCSFRVCLSQPVHGRHCTC